MLTELGLWDLASADFVKAFALQKPATTTDWYRHALLRIYLGHPDEFGQIRHEMQERFGGVTNIAISVELVRTCVLAGESEEPEAVVQLAQQIAEGRPNDWFRLYLLGLAHYRAEQYEQARIRLTESLTAGSEWPCRDLSYPVLAMAHHRLGHEEEARRALAAAAQAIEGWTQEMFKGSAGMPWTHHQGATITWPVAWWDWLECQVYYREAASLIDGSSLPDDPRRHVLRARSLAGLARNFTADVEYAKALKGLPNDRQIQLEAHRSAGYSAVGRREWHQAAGEFQLAVELEPEDAYLWRFLIVAHLAGGDETAYRQSCRAMQVRFAETTDWQVAGNLALVCVLKDDALPDMSPLLPLAQVAAPWPHLGNYVLGAALYRAGKYAAAVRTFENGARIYRPRGWDWSFLAMAHHRLGHTEEARRCLAKAKQWVSEANNHGNSDLADAGVGWANWQERVVCRLLLREAVALIPPDNTPAQP
jgi:Flp pilus assembly protein TadD